VTRAEFCKKLDTITNSPPGTIRGDEELLDVPGWDSLSVPEFVLMMKDAVGVTLTGYDVQKCKTVPELMGLLPGKIEP
jgi:acyl carrier protein